VAATIERVLRGANALAAAAAAACIWVLTSIICFDVIARTAGAPTLWGAESAVYLMVALGFLGAGHTFDRDGHFRVGIVADRLPGRGAAWLDLAVSLMALAFVGLFAFGSAQLVLMLKGLGFRSSTLMQVPVWIPMMPVAVGTTFLASAILLRVIRLIRGLREGSTPVQRVEHSF
jgi:TRAP-type C4-dicarboxylate transport system permease small subunit